MDQPMYQQLTLCPFLASERIKGTHGSYFKLDKENRCLRYKVTHESRRRVMSHVCKKLENKIKEDNNSPISEKMFEKCFSNWFILLTKTSIYSFDKNYAKFENVFINDFNILLNEFKNQHEEELDVNTGKFRAVGTVHIEPTERQQHSGDVEAGDLISEESTTQAEDKEQSKSHSGNLKARKSKTVVFDLKKGKVRVEFDNPPTLKDIEILTEYLKYKLL
ncbi:hypothetical protein GR140_18855 [Pseudomonas putida]|uniref:hypothetical protein n=1 Tax=Pseudomonas putida TaxID=303 RepID=UPI001BB0CC14|nr:hypothetical protein [Pseudomonas putida]QUG90725.1 hypothetical protein GR140_18855 [Pseudomonas putida]